MASIDGTAVNVALPTMQRSLHATAADLQWVIEAYSLFLAALSLVGGSLHVSAAVARALDAQRAKYVDAAVPSGVGPRETTQIRTVLKESYVAAFRVSVLVAAALAGGSALFAAWLIEGKPPERVEGPAVDTPGRDLER